MKAPLSFIVAMTREGVIGCDNRLPWHLPKDLQYFKEITLGCPVIMGRKTFESIGRPLPGRKNFVITSNPAKIAEPAIGVATLNEAVEKARAPGPRQIFVIGGAQIFREALPLADSLYITWIERPYRGDILFPTLNFKEFRELSRFERGSPEAHRYSYYERR